nr:unnamed protein product [Spirometra erinaceieuropaei]
MSRVGRVTSGRLLPATVKVTTVGGAATRSPVLSAQSGLTVAVYVAPGHPAESSSVIAEGRRLSKLLTGPLSPSRKTPRTTEPRTPPAGKADDTDSPVGLGISTARTTNAEGDNAPVLAATQGPPPIIITAAPPTSRTKSRPLTSRKKAASGDGVPKSHPALISSLFPNVPPCVRFFDEHEKVESLPWEFRRLLHYRPSIMTPIIVRQVLSRSAFRASKLTTVTEDLDAVESTDWIYYFGKHMRPAVFLSIRDYQKVLHFLSPSVQHLLAKGPL